MVARDRRRDFLRPPSLSAVASFRQPTATAPVSSQRRFDRPSPVHSLERDLRAAASQKGKVAAVAACAA